MEVMKVREEGLEDQMDPRFREDDGKGTMLRAPQMTGAYCAEPSLLTCITCITAKR